MILDPLSLKIISGEIKEKEKIIVDLGENEIIFRTKNDLIKNPFPKEKREKVLV